MDKNQELMKRLDALIHDALEQKKMWVRRMEVAQEHVNEAEEYIRTLEILRMEILFKE